MYVIFLLPFPRLRPFLMVIHLFSLYGHSYVPPFYSSHLASFISTFFVSPFLCTRNFLNTHTHSQRCANSYTYLILVSFLFSSVLYLELFLLNIATVHKSHEFKFSLQLRVQILTPSAFQTYTLDSLTRFL